MIAQAQKKIDVIYETPHRSFAEILNCIASYQKDKVEIWGTYPGAGLIQDDISKRMNLPGKVIVNITFLGGGFGRKAFMDYPHGC